MRSLSVEFPLNRTDYNDFKHEFLSILSNTNMEYMLFKIYIYIWYMHILFGIYVNLLLVLPNFLDH